jgi:hypothetical protein
MLALVAVVAQVVVMEVLVTLVVGIPVKAETGGNMVAVAVLVAVAELLAVAVD